MCTAKVIKISIATSPELQNCKENVVTELTLVINLKRKVTKTAKRVMYIVVEVKNEYQHGSERWSDVQGQNRKDQHDQTCKPPSCAWITVER